MPNIDSFQLPQEFLIVGAAAQTELFEEIENNPCTLDGNSSIQVTEIGIDGEKIPD